ncbi:MAG: SGNH/GDSL hydrolase family protein, partial [Pirellulaceae bacterium]|nr:SGNH/GDSL hydrolase family protein [Pirellulaceae bacterium]
MVGRSQDGWAHKWVALIAVLAALAAQPLAAQDETAKFATPLPAVELADGDSIVFLGDSITHQCLYTQYVEDFLYTRMPTKRLRLHNAGVGGAKAWDALERFEADVARYKPKYVTVLLGMNDGRYTPYNEEIFRTYHTDMTKVIEQIRAIGATPILMTPTMFDARAARMKPRHNRNPDSVELYNSVLAYYGAWLRERAAAGGYGFVDMYSPLNNITIAERKKDPSFTVIADAVHPGPAGQVIMACALINDIGLPKNVSNIRISRTGEDKVAPRVAGGKISDARFTEDGLVFTWHAKCLPWALPAEAELGAKLAKLGHRYSREALEIHGLPSGKYELQIDGEVVGVFSSAALEKHIELQANTKTPQYAQAAQVAALNKQRNEGPVRSLRNEWRVFQQFARVRAQAIAEPDNADAAKQLAGLEKRIDGIDQRVAEHE